MCATSVVRLGTPYKYRQPRFFTYSIASQTYDFGIGGTMNSISALVSGEPSTMEM
jgi:hypothetical protein